MTTETRERTLRLLFDKFIDEAIWQGYKLHEIEQAAPDVFKDYDRFLAMMGRHHQIR